MKYDGIIFDMDGTLWDSAENVARSWNAAIARAGISHRELTTEDIQGVMGMTMDAIADKLFPELGMKERMELLGFCCQLENEYLREHGGVLYPNTETTLRALSQTVRLFIVSNCQSGYIEAFLEHYRLSALITDKLCWGDTRLEKSDNIRLVIERNRLANALYVGDTQGDCDSAYTAGADFAYAAYGFGTADRYDIRLDDISGLTRALGEE